MLTLCGRVVLTMLRHFLPYFLAEVISKFHFPCAIFHTKIVKCWELMKASSILLLLLLFGPKVTEHADRRNVSAAAPLFTFDLYDADGGGLFSLQCNYHIIFLPRFNVRILGFTFDCMKLFMFGMAWYGMVWYGMVWYGMVWYGMV